MAWGRNAGGSMPFEQINGTPIFFEERGVGESVVLVHGTTGTHAGWALVAPTLATDFRVIAYDRRGCGHSGDGMDHSLQHDAADLASIVDWLGTSVHLVGHSYGARVAMLAAQHNANVATLVLYEPPLDFAAVTSGTWDAIDEATLAQDWDQVLERFYPLVGITQDEIAVLRLFPSEWDAALDGARTVSREVRALRSAPVDVNALRCVASRTLVIRGGETTSPLFLNALDAVIDALDADIEVIDGQRHLAAVGAPDAVAAAVHAFISQHGGRSSPSTTEPA